MRTNRYIAPEDRDFFVLLRTALWQKVEEELSSEPNWDGIYQLSCDQAVQGLVADGLYLYREAHPELVVPAATEQRFLLDSTRIIQANHTLNAVQARLCQFFDQRGITYVVMKGQAVAQCYPKPELRMSGDIDYYMDYANYELAKEYLSPMAERSEAESNFEKHVAFFFDGTEVELHADEAYTIGGQKLFHTLLAQMLTEGHFPQFDCNGVRVNAAPASFHVLYSLLHSNKHELKEELGLRQLCDFALLLHATHSELDYPWLRRHIRKFALGRSWRKYVGFAQEYLGVPQEELSSMNPNLKDCPILWKQCRVYGNFGRGSHAEESEQLHAECYKERIILRFVYARRMILNDYGNRPLKAFGKLLGLYWSYVSLTFRKLLHIGGDKFHVILK